MSTRANDAQATFIRYQADISVQVAADEEIVSVVVDSGTMERLVQIVGPDGAAVHGFRRDATIAAAKTGALAIIGFRACTGHLSPPWMTG